MAADFDRIFNPKRIAFVGVSAGGYGFANEMLSSHLKMGFAGAIYPVNPKGGEIFGLTIYRSVEEIPESIDFAIIAVAARFVPETLEACRLKGAAGAEIVSAGFREAATNEGADLEQRVKAICAKGIRVVGPNCFGIYCPESGLTFVPGPDLSRTPGGVAFVSQSGGMSIDFALLGRSLGLRYSKIISLGNGVDLRETELLKYLGDDEKTKVIAMYVEGVEDGTLFFETLKKVTAAKPVVIYKGGLSDAGQRAVQSHTASLGGSRAIWEGTLRQAGAVQVSNLYEAVQTCLAFSLLPIRPYRSMAVIGGGGALGVAACDAAERFDLAIPRLKDEVRDKIDLLLPKPGSSADNPIDVANPYVAPQTIAEILREAAGDERIDIQVLVQLLYHYKSLAINMGLASLKDITPTAILAEGVEDVVAKTGKPVVMVLPNHRQEPGELDVEEMLRSAKKAFLERGIPVFDDLDEALRAIHHVARYCQGL
ncbi:MAG: CoA-binding protein [Smithellaceae bacterium]|nr:CoA-binding protein [Smithellaceae bacterium]